MRIRLDISPGYTLVRTTGWPGMASKQNQMELCVSLLICAYACVGADRGEAEEGKDGHDENKGVQVCTFHAMFLWLCLWARRIRQREKRPRWQE